MVSKMKKSRLGDYIELVDVRNSDNSFGVEDVRGISTSKVFIKTKADLNGVNLSSYKIVGLNQFAYVADTSRRGDKIGLAFADKEPCIISGIYTVFKVKNDVGLLPRYLMMFFNRAEFDRYSRFNSWGSARETFSWEDFCDIELEIPDKTIQEKYVAIYHSLLANLRSYEKGLEDLKLVFNGFIEDVRRKQYVESIKPYLKERTETNKNGDDIILRGVGLKGFIEPNQARTKDSLKKCNIFYKGDFVYAPSSFKNGVVTYNDFYEKALCTEEYVVFYIKDKEKLNPYYLEMWLKRSELGRSIDFYVLDSVRNRFYFDNMDMITIPIPEKSVQDSIASIYREYLKRIEYRDLLKQKIANICPILIRGSVKEAKGGN